MPVSPTYPGVYIEEISSGVRTITGVATSITAFIGRAKRGPTDEPVTINSYGDYERIFGGLWNESSMSYAVRDFYLNGGNQAIIVRLYNPAYTEEERLQAREAANIFAGAISGIVPVGAKNDPTVTVTVDSVKAEIRKLANTYDFGEDVKVKAVKSAAVATVLDFVSNAPPGTNAQLVKDAAFEKATNLANVAEPRKTALRRMATAAGDAASKPDTTTAKVVQAVCDEWKDIIDPTKGVGLAVDTVAKAAEEAAGKAGATLESVIKQAWDQAKDPSNKDEPNKTTTDRVAKAAQSAVSQPNATVATIAEKARDEANTIMDEMREAATNVFNAAKVEAFKDIENIIDSAQPAVELASPQSKAQLQVSTMILEAANQGIWANQLRARVDYDLPKALPENYAPYKLSRDDLFNLTVLDGETGLAEVFRNVTVKPSPRQVDKVLENESRLVRVCGTIDPARPEESKSPQKGQMPWDDNDPPTNYKVSKSKPASDGSVLKQNDFTERGEKAGLYALEKADLFNLLCIPPCLDDPKAFANLIDIAAQYCEKRRAMLIVDPPSSWKNKEDAKAFSDVDTRSKNAALFFPRLKQPNPLHDNQVEEFVPCGVVAGIFARTDSTRGIWKAPAGLEAILVGVPELSVSLTDLENGELNQLGINCLRTMPGVGRVVWGARTLQGNDRLASEWKYIPVRRLALFIEESLYRGTQWVVFEPNDEPLWAQIRLNIGAFMNNLFRQGAFQGRTPREAYFVKCDKETTTQNDINLGIVNIVVGFAPLKPAEFVIIQLQQMAGQIQV